jgi:hypothetical protein
MSEADPRVTKRRVTMTNWIQVPGPEGKPELREITATDYVRPDFLDAYVAKAQETWSSVEVSEEPDAGPAGYEGQTYVPEDLDHPLAGHLFPATTPTED